MEKVLGMKPSEYLPSKLYYVCFDEVCLIHESLEKVNGAIVLYGGSWIGLVLKGEAYLSTWLYEKAFRERGYRACIVVSDLGVKNFLYGKDVLEESVVEKYPPTDNPVAVVDRADYKVVGVARPRGRGDRVIYENVYDLGWFLRVLG